jgi:hypothetical protein
VNLFAKATSLLPESDRFRLELLPDLIAAAIEAREFDRASDLLADALEVAGSSRDPDLTTRLLPLQSKLDAMRDDATPAAR